MITALRTGLSAEAKELIAAIPAAQRENVAVGALIDLADAEHRPGMVSAVWAARATNYFDLPDLAALANRIEAAGLQILPLAGGSTDDPLILLLPPDLESGGGIPGGYQRTIR